VRVRITQPWPGAVTSISLIACLAVSVLAGCGTSRSAPARTDRHEVRYLPNGLYTLAEQRMPGGSILRVRIERYEFRGQLTSAIGVIEDDPRLRRDREGVVASFPVGPRGPDEPGPLRIDIERSCVGSREVIIAYGLLRGRGDTVVAQGRGVVQSLRKVSIPARFRAGGSLVYTVLTWLPTEIVTRAANGRVVGVEKFPLPTPPC
jgi:hypothetical protein